MKIRHGCGCFGRLNSFNHVHLLAFACASLVGLAFVCVAVVTGVVVVSSSTDLQQYFTQCPVLPQFLHRLMSVMLVLCASSFLVSVFAFALSLAFLERVNLHPVVIIRTCPISSSHSRGCSKVSGRRPMQQSCSKSGTVCPCTELQIVPKKNWCHIHHHCPFDCIRHPAPWFSRLFQKPSARPHQSFAGIMIFCNKAY